MTNTDLERLIGLEQKTEKLAEILTKMVESLDKVAHSVDESIKFTGEWVSGVQSDVADLRASMYSEFAAIEKLLSNDEVGGKVGIEQLLDKIENDIKEFDEKAEERSQKAVSALAQRQQAIAEMVGKLKQKKVIIK